MCVNVCHDICIKLDAGAGHRNFKDARKCRSCNIFMVTEEYRCPCCGNLLASRTRDPHTLSNAIHERIEL